MRSARSCCKSKRQQTASQVAVLAHPIPKMMKACQIPQMNGNSGGMSRPQRRTPTSRTARAATMSQSIHSLKLLQLLQVGVQGRDLHRLRARRRLQAYHSARSWARTTHQIEPTRCQHLRQVLRLPQRRLQMWWARRCVRRLLRPQQ